MQAKWVEVMPLKSVLQHVTTDGKFDIDKAREMKGWLARLRGEIEWYPIICVREHVQLDGHPIAILADGKDYNRKYAANDLLCVPANTIGHWVVNGHAFCRTSYDTKIGEHIFNCACTHQKYLGMSKALKDKYPDGSSKQVFWTRWYPTSCGTQYEDRDDVQPHNIHLNERWYVNLTLMTEALEQVTGGMSNSSGYEISMRHCDWPNMDGEEPEMKHALVLHMDRYIMNPHGFHIGYERYEGVLEILKARDNERHVTHKHGAWIVDIDSLEVRVVDAPEEETCACQNGDCACALEDEEHCCNDDECICELYMGADEDFTYDAIDNLLREALAIPLYWHFDRDTGTWNIVNSQTDEIMWEANVESMPPAQAPLV